MVNWSWQTFSKMCKQKKLWKLKPCLQRVFADTFTLVLTSLQRQPTCHGHSPLSSRRSAWSDSIAYFHLLSHFGPEARTLHIPDLEISISLAYVCAISLLTVYFVAFLKLFYLLAGFISQLAQGKPIDECVRCGHYAANYMIQQSGVTMTQLPNFS